MGFLKTGADVGNMMDTGRRATCYFGIVSYLAPRPLLVFLAMAIPIPLKCRAPNTAQIGQMPWLDRVLGKNPYCPIKFATFKDTAVYSYQKMMERASAQDHKSHGDFLDNFLEAKEQHPDVVGDNEVVSYIMMNVSVRDRNA